jgi:hypothetical protein
MTPYRRYELLLPLRFNDGSVIPEAFVDQTIDEIKERFGAISLESQSILGSWKTGSAEHHDENLRLFADVPDTPEHRQFFVELKEQLKARFQQLDIWITTHPLDVL